jgi:hypothetical protein
MSQKVFLYALKSFYI